MKIFLILQQVVRIVTVWL